MSIFESFQRHLPTGLYRFVGGLADGKELPVRMHHDEYGTWPPQVWNVYGDVQYLDFDSVSPGNVTVTRHRYRFVCTGRIGNVGHYEWIPQ